jgi:hypothetical protein
VIDPWINPAEGSSKAAQRAWEGMFGCLAAADRSAGKNDIPAVGDFKSLVDAYRQ